jgi:hypothetical protein
LSEGRVALHVFGRDDIEEFLMCHRAERRRAFTPVGSEDVVDGRVAAEDLHPEHRARAVCPDGRRARDRLLDFPQADGKRIGIDRRRVGGRGGRGRIFLLLRKRRCTLGGRHQQEHEGNPQIPHHRL